MPPNRSPICYMRFPIWGVWRDRRIAATRRLALGPIPRLPGGLPFRSLGRRQPPPRHYGFGGGCLRAGCLAIGYACGVNGWKLPPPTRLGSVLFEASALHRCGKLGDVLRVL